MATAEDRGLEDLNRDRILNIGFPKSPYPGGTADSELSEMWKPSFWPSRKGMDLPEVPCLPIPLRPGRQIQPLLWNQQDLHHSATFRQGILWNLQNPEP